MKVLITGGAGYIGTELVNALSTEKGVDEIVVYDNLGRGNRNLFIGKTKLNGRVKFVDGEILDTRKLLKSLDGVKMVFHLAARVSTPFSDSDSHLFDQVNHWGTANVVDAIKLSSVKRFVYLSSASIYGSQKDIITVNTPPHPKSFYGISKLRGEDHVNLLREHLNTYVIRCGNVFGYSRSMRFDAVINRFMFDANFKGRLSIQGDGSQSRAFIHLQSAIDVLVNLTKDITEPGTYNLVERNHSVIEIANTLKVIYPDLEMLHIDQHLQLRSIQVERDERLQLPKELPLKKLLEAFKKEFTF